MTEGLISHVARQSLPEVTLCAATSVNIAATIQALETSLSQMNFAGAKLFTDKKVKPEHPGIVVIPTAPFTSSRAYSEFILSKMVDYVETSHCLIVQWDGHVLDSRLWREEFLDYDYIGASWPQFADGHDVGNGGFSLRSRALMQLCRHADFQYHALEDVAIGRLNRLWLENMGMRFASRQLADSFSTERAGDIKTSFGYHGAWLMPEAIGIEKFWNLYQNLDNRRTIRHDFSEIFKKIISKSGGFKKAIKLTLDQVLYIK